ncbi:Glyoxylase, beta-lactamase superfamily II [Sphingomonas laterariae]|uniref:Glyoxylase, beta-lactamase superfamily II n=1 Tax=Edaphosphingomonas laterariae TaxID=861865 RepID=A0A239EPP2_9SPHN|nr:N-acyl homoserine lactonase family protein [Sphingomonas laterariae]SNS45993.1 Glyoxylase, beta-lactamase superfamily II [Sphingomonas laterariae]
MKRLAALAAGLALAAAAPATSATPATPPEIKLWRLDCGHVTNADLDMFADSYALAGKRKDLVISCYLVRHGNDYLLWDAGFGAELAGRVQQGPPEITSSLKRTIVDQLRDIGVKPEQVRHVGISHMHYDHVGQAASFPTATLLIGAEDLAILSAGPEKPLLEPKRLAPWIAGKAPREAVVGDKDVYGDGSVVMLTTPGHTPGHHALLVRLKNKGPVLITGDLYHVAEQVPLRAVPRFNMDRVQTLSSQQRFGAIADALKATVIIEHEPADVPKLPAFPEAAD